MRNEARRDSMKVWLYAIASILLAAALAPWLYNLGKALAEVTQGKQTNGVVEWLAAGCRKAGFATYFKWAWGAAAAILAVPLIGWLKVGRGAGNRTTPWSVRLPGGGRANDGGQRLRFGRRAGWDALGGFGLSLAFGAVLIVTGIQAGVIQWAGGTSGLAGTAGRLLPWAVGLAVINEAVFRGVALGIFLRAMGVTTAISMAALLSAGVGWLGPMAGSVAVDPELPGAGFSLLGKLVEQLVAPWVFTAEFLPFLALGWLMGHARWRTVSLGLPVGLHAGWIISNGVLRELTRSMSVADSPVRALAEMALRHGWLPLGALILAWGGWCLFIPEPKQFNDDDI